MRYFVLAALLLLAPLVTRAQGVLTGANGAQAPDCLFTSGSSGGQSAVGKYGPNGGSNTFFDNTQAQCAIWHLVYTATSNVGSISIELDGANTGTTFGTPGSFAALTGLAPGSNNPSTATGGADIAVAPTTVPAYVQVNLGTLSAGSVRWWAIGYRPNATTTPGTGFGSFVFVAPQSSFLSGQQAVTASAVALATNNAKNVCVKALIGNTINVYIGPSGTTTSTGDELTPGEGRCFTLSNTNLIFVVASTTGASVSWSATF